MGRFSKKKEEPVVISDADGVVTETKAEQPEAKAVCTEHEFHPDTIDKLQKNLSHRGQCLRCGTAVDKADIGIFKFDDTEVEKVSQPVEPDSTDE